jgi:hypothetical protein
MHVSSPHAMPPVLVVASPLEVSSTAVVALDDELAVVVVLMLAAVVLADVVLVEPSPAPSSSSATFGPQPSNDESTTLRTRQTIVHPS